MREAANTVRTSQGMTEEAGQLIATNASLSSNVLSKLGVAAGDSVGFEELAGRLGVSVQLARARVHKSPWGKPRCLFGLAS